MRVTALFSPRQFALSLLSLGLLTSVCAAPLPSDGEGVAMTLHRRGKTMTIDGKVAELGDLLSPASHTKSEVHRLAKWNGKANPGYVLKVYKTSTLDQKEIDGLKTVGQWIASDAAAKAVVMKEAKGTLFSKILAAEPADKRSALMNSWLPKIAKAAAAIAKDKGILHIDMNADNIVIDGATITFIDWEHYYLRTNAEFTSDAAKIEENYLSLMDTPKSPKAGSPKSR